MKPQVLTSDLRAKLSSVRVANSDANLRNFPDFLILGPQRTGTTWLFHNLKGHPEIFLPKEKELYYFSTLGTPNHRRFRFPYLEGYLHAMTDSPRSKLKRHYDSLRKVGRLYHPSIRGEATASYAALPKEVIRDIATLNPEIKAILMIRDPIDRAWSHARKDLLTAGRPADDLDPDALSRLLFKDEQRELALYRTLIENWRSHLQPGHLFVGVFDSIASDPERSPGRSSWLSRRRVRETIFRSPVAPSHQSGSSSDNSARDWESRARDAATGMRRLRPVAKGNHRCGRGVSLLLRQ